jgi:predicted RNase H-like HicB family nuclease
MKTTKKHSFSVFWSEDDRSYICSSSLLPGLMAFGKTKEEALAEGEVVLGGMLQSLKDKGEKIKTQEKKRRMNTLSQEYKEMASEQSEFIKDWSVTEAEGM